MNSHEMQTRSMTRALLRPIAVSKPSNKPLPQLNVDIMGIIQDKLGEMTKNKLEDETNCGKCTINGSHQYSSRGRVHFEMKSDVVQLQPIDFIIFHTPIFKETSIVEMTNAAEMDDLFRLYYYARHHSGFKWPSFNGIKLIRLPDDYHDNFTDRSLDKLAFTVERNKEYGIVDTFVEAKHIKECLLNWCVREMFEKQDDEGDDEGPFTEWLADLADYEAL